MDHNLYLSLAGSMLAAISACGLFSTHLASIASSSTSNLSVLSLMCPELGLNNFPNSLFVML